MKLCEEKRLLDKIPKLEETKGSDFVLRNLQGKAASAKNFVIEICKEGFTRGDVLMITGVGEAYPFIRAHDILNTIQPMDLNNIPIVVAGGAAGKTDPLMVKVADLADVKYDRLLSRTRNVLRKQFGYPKNGKKMKIKAVYCEQESILSREINPGDDLPKIGASMCVTSTCGLNLAAVVLKDLNS